MSAKTQNEAFWRAENRWREKWEAEEPITDAEKEYGQYLRTCERLQGFATGWIAGIAWANRKANKKHILSNKQVTEST